MVRITHCGFYRLARCVEEETERVGIETDQYIVPNWGSHESECKC